MSTPGLVISLRINPPDVMAVMDTVDYLGIPRANLSFAQMTKLVLSSALESFRQNGIVPRRDGFEYLQMLESLERDNFSARGAKLKQAQIIRDPRHTVPAIVPDSPERASRRIRYEELYFKFKNDELNMTQEEKDELRPLMEEFFS